eukprot:PLAT1660.2.p2 GENE.PLAT1660.2~~PLAT1660.2.p2  ORF type:complete len:437 (-),score=179.82 PLAT1660.2:595-1905(-)
MELMPSSATTRQRSPSSSTAPFHEMAGADSELKPSVRNNAAFWLLGLVNNFSYVVMLSAAEELFPGNAGAVLAADIVPTLLVKVTAPFWVHRLPYALRVLLCTVLNFASFYTVAVASSTTISLLGVTFASAAGGLGEITFLALSSFFHKSTVTAWSSGTGMAGIAGSGWYLLLRFVLRVTPRVTLLLGGLWPIAYALTYAFLLQRPDKAGGKGDRKALLPAESTATEDSEAGVAVTPDSCSSDEVDDGADGAAVGAATAHMSFSQRLTRIRLLLPYMLPLAIVYAAEYTINTGIAGTLAFPHVKAHTFYVYHGFVYQIGVFISRSSGELLPQKRLWPMPVLQSALLVFFLIQALSPFIGAAWLMLCFTFAVGLLGGATYVNAFRRITVDVEPKYREFSLGAASVADTLGIVAASIVSIFLECALLRHDGLSPKHCA